MEVHDDVRVDKKIDPASADSTPSWLCSMFAFFGSREPPPSYVFAPDESFAGIRLEQTTFSSLPEVNTAFDAVQRGVSLTRLESRTILECTRDRNYITRAREQHLGIAVLEQCEREHRRLTDEVIQARRQLREKKRSQKDPSIAVLCIL